MAGAAPSIRYEWPDFLNVGTPSAPVWALFGRGATQLDESPSAVVDTVAYISDRSASGTITGYQNQFAFTAERIMTETALKWLYDVGLYQKTGADCQTQLLRVMDDEPVDGQADTFKARLFTVAAEVANFSGAGTEKIVCDGTLHQVGDLTVGTYNRATKTFAPSTVTGVTVAPITASVAKGGTQTFTATVAGTSTPAQTVGWTVTGGISADTVIDTAGELTVGADETATALTVKATSTVDATKSGTATVTVTAA